MFNERKTDIRTKRPTKFLKNFYKGEPWWSRAQSAWRQKKNGSKSVRSEKKSTIKSRQENRYDSNNV